MHNFVLLDCHQVFRMSPQRTLVSTYALGAHPSEGRSITLMKSYYAWIDLNKDLSQNKDYSKSLIAIILAGKASSKEAVDFSFRMTR